MAMLWRSLHLKLTGAMLLVLALDGTGYLLAINSIGERQTAPIPCLQAIFVAVAVLTITAGLVLPGMIGHAVGEVAQAANRLATGALADLSDATPALKPRNRAGRDPTAADRPTRAEGGGGRLGGAGQTTPRWMAAPVPHTDGGEPEGTDDVLLGPVPCEGAGVAGLLRLVDVPAAFGHEGRDALTILTTTAAIALENIGLLAREHEARAAAEAAVRVRDDFLTAASHDLRTPLTAIQGHTDLMQMRLGSGAAIDSPWLGARIGALQAAGRRMVATVEEITDVAELQIGHRLDLNVQPVDVGELVRVAVALVDGSAPRGAAP